MNRHEILPRCAVFLLALLFLASCSRRTPAVATIGGESVSQDEARFVLHTTAERYAMYMGGEVNWDGLVDGLPGGEYLRSLTLDALASARVLRTKTAEYGCPLTDDDIEWVGQAMAEDEADAGGAEAFEELLASLGGTRELYRLYRYEVSLMEDNLISHLFGPGGPYAPNDETLRAFCETGMARCAYVFLSLTDDETGLRLNGEDYDRLKAVADAIHRQAAETVTPGDGAPNSAFAEIVATYGQDYAMNLFPEGITLPKDYHGSAFREALDALGPGELSPVVEATNGLYIILRLDPDPGYPDEYRAEAEDAYRLATYGTLMEQWKGELGVKTQKGFEELGIES